MGVGSAAGAFLPVLLGDASLLDGWSILGTLVGGLAGVWLGYKVGRALK